MKKLAAAVLLAAIALTGAAAQPASHPLPLHDGFYLDATIPCGAAYSAAMIQIMGARFESGRSLCTITSVTRQGTSFAAIDTCQDTSTGEKRAGKLTVVIPDAHTLIVGAKDDRTRYRYCPISSLPPSFKDAKEMVPDTPPFD